MSAPIRISRVEFIFLMAALMATTALSIDAVLPALGFMANDFGTSGSEIQLIITVLFVGFVLGQIVFGPLSDRFGRLPSIYAGIVLFILGCLITITAQSLELALLGRFIQGIGVSGPRIMVSALVRDCYSGRSMARIMSFVATIFMIVPILAPMLGQAMLWLGPWQVIFVMYIVIAIILCLWVRLRLDETLIEENRNSIQIKSLWHSFVGILTNRISCGYTIVSGFVFGGFLGYLSSSQWLFQGIYQVGEAFPIYFGALVLPNLVSSLINAKLVVKWGMFRLVQVTNVLVFFGSLLFMGGVLFGYYVISPLSVQFLGNYTVSSTVSNSISLNSYISTLTSITLACAIVFQLPIIVYFLSKVGILTPQLMKAYRKHSIVVVLILAAIITPPDITSQILVAIPLVFLYEVSIIISRMVVRKQAT